MVQDSKNRQRTFRVLQINDVMFSRNGHPYLECVTDEGLVALGGGANNRGNIEKIQTGTIPFTVRCNPWFKSNWEQHAFWIPEGSKIESLSDEITTASDTSDVRSSTDLKTPESMSVDELADIRLEIIGIVKSAEAQCKGDDNSEVGIAQRISILSKWKFVPREVAAMMRTLTEMRNVTEYESTVLSERQSVAARATWEAVQEWARKEGYC